MLDLRLVVDHLDDVRMALGRRSAAVAALMEPIAALDAERRRVIASSESQAAARNAASKAMAQADKASPEFAARRAELKELERQLGEVQQRIEAELARVPNLPEASTPDGAGAEDNPVVHVWGQAAPMAFAPKPHWELGTKLGLLDFERASKLSGARFTVMTGAGARLERALGAFMLDLHTEEHGYREISPPYLIKDRALYGTGQLPKFAADLFRIEGSSRPRAAEPVESPGAGERADAPGGYDLFLSPTAEVQLTNLHADEILDADALPLAYTAHTPCFRSEAGSYGQDVRGMIRQHQFHKVELVRICTPESSAEELERLTGHAEEVLKRLGLHFRRVALCTGDLGFSAAKTYDLEVWLPAQGAFREISSCSNCTDFQARRAKIRYRPERGAKPRLVHTLNGSGLAVGRTVIALLEQYQQADGSVVVPEALRDRMNCEVLRR
jgi:seryl-tRNA synthetase